MAKTGVGQSEHVNVGVQIDYMLTVCIGPVMKVVINDISTNLEK